MNEIIEKLLMFRKDRNWGKFHNPKDLSISLMIEAGELLENFQWKESKEAVTLQFENIKDELADVMIYALLLANDLNIDIKEAILSKIEKNKEKYPIEKSYGSYKKYTEF